MRLRKFIKADRAEDIKTEPDLIRGVQKLNPLQVKKIFSKFVPLDFAALIQKYNPKAFDKVLTTQIQKGLQSSRIKNIINYISKLERGYQQEDAISDALEKMLNDDPKRRGILNQVFMDGTFSDSWKYVKVDRRTKEGDELNTLIKNSLGTSDGLTIPFCPNCKAIGQESPLWGYKISILVNF